ncbi:MAG: methyltransferase domain-containing protein [Thermoanaerobaculia bacterium]
MKARTPGELLLNTASPWRAISAAFRSRLGIGPLPKKLQWTRQVMYQQLESYVRELGPERLSTLEIAGGDFWQQLGFGSYKTVEYPEFDLCADTLDEKFDLIIADQVFEHVLWPYRAAKNARSMLKEGGQLLVTTPFLIRVHDVPVDCTRWTELGLKHLLAEAGFDIDRISTGSWGNKACVKANLKRNGWAVLTRFASLKNDPLFPCVVWAIAKR